ncbi:hypothetical protein [Priestia megaterium]|uniref:Uncharacterized protein n=1 Tax=Priestia megaterium TaxID=1404 RepID=A0A6M6E3E8_PRIMG|nr:hypothetical protein [Priestia megaterium]QJX80236.1 hypothetical protein FDZ14_29505 [Priestia megaterium]
MNKLENKNQVKKIIYKSEGSDFCKELDIDYLIKQIERQYAASDTNMTDDGLYKPLFIKSLLKVESPYQHPRIEVAARYKIITEEEKNDFYLKGLGEREDFIKTIRRRIISFESGLSARLKTLSKLPGTFHLSVKKDENKPNVEEYGIFYKGEPFNLKCLKCKESFYEGLKESGINSVSCHNKRGKCSNKEKVVDGNFRYFEKINKRNLLLV